MKKYFLIILTIFFGCSSNPDNNIGTWVNSASPQISFIIKKDTISYNTYDDYGEQLIWSKYKIIEKRKLHTNYQSTLYYIQSVNFNDFSAFIVHRDSSNRIRSPQQVFSFETLEKLDSLCNAENKRIVSSANRSIIYLNQQNYETLSNFPTLDTVTGKDYADLLEKSITLYENLQNKDTILTGFINFDIKYNLLCQVLINEKLNPFESIKKVEKIDKFFGNINHLNNIDNIDSNILITQKPNSKKIKELEEKLYLMLGKSYYNK